LCTPMIMLVEMVLIMLMGMGRTHHSVWFSFDSRLLESYFRYRDWNVVFGNDYL
jgi:hypothetical protein